MRTSRYTPAGLQTWTPRNGLTAIVILAAASFGASSAGCTPRVALEAHEVRVKVDRELDDLFAKNPELF